MLIDRGYSLDCLALFVSVGSALLANARHRNIFTLFGTRNFQICPQKSLEDVSFELAATSLVCFLHNSWYPVLTK